MYELVTNQFAFSQIKLNIVGAENNKPLKFVSIVNITQKKLLFTDNDGNIYDKISNNDTLSISHIGYIPKTIVYSDNYITHKLVQSIENLETVKLKSCSKFKYVNFKNYDDGIINQAFGGVTFNKMDNIGKCAVLIKTPIADAMLNTFSLWLIKIPGSTNDALIAPLRFSFYEIDDSSNLPSNLITEKQVLYHPKKFGQQKLNLDSLQIKIPNNGLFIVFEYIPNGYEYKMNLIDKEKNTTETISYFGGRIDGTKAINSAIVFYNFLKNRWFYPNYINGFDKSKIVGTIKYELGLKYCKH